MRCQVQLSLSLTDNCQVHHGPPPRHVPAERGIRQRGEVFLHIRGPDPSLLKRLSASRYVLDLRLFEHNIDLEIMAEGVKFMQQLIAQPALRDDAGVRPIAAGAEVQSDDEINEYVRQACFTSYHPVGSASMLPPEEGGVVYPDLVACSTANLRTVRLPLFGNTA